MIGIILAQVLESDFIKPFIAGLFCARRQDAIGDGHEHLTTLDSQVAMFYVASGCCESGSLHDILLIVYWASSLWHKAVRFNKVTFVTTLNVSQDVDHPLSRTLARVSLSANFLQGAPVLSIAFGIIKNFSELQSPIRNKPSGVPGSGPDCRVTFGCCVIYPNRDYLLKQLNHSSNSLS
jgi:hypothetical protein